MTIWIGTRKGAFALRSDARRRTWKLSGPQFLGHVIHHIVQDPREPRVLLMGAKTGHLGPTVFRSTDRGRHWKEASKPPAFRKAADGETPRAVDAVFWLTARSRIRDGHLVRGQLARGFVPFGRRRGYLGVGGRVQRSPDAAAVGTRARHARRRAAAFGNRRSARSEAPVSRHLDRRRVRVDRWRARLGAAQRRGRCGFPAGPERSLRSRSAQRRVASGTARPALSAEPLRYLSHRPARAALDSHRRGDAEEDRRRRFPDRARSGGSGHRVGVSDGRHDCVAAYLGRWQAGGVRHPGRGSELAQAGPRAATLARRGSRCSARRCAPTRTHAPVFTSATPAGKSGRAATAAIPGRASRGICRRSTR